MAAIRVDADNFLHGNTCASTPKYADQVFCQVGYMVAVWGGYDDLAANRRLHARVKPMCVDVKQSQECRGVNAMERITTTFRALS
jgi:hypothetical protein